MMADLKGLNVGEFGKTVSLYCRWNGIVQDLSNYSTSAGYVYMVKCWSPKPVKEISFPAGPTSTANEAAGIVQFSPSSDKYFDRPGIWEGQIFIEGPGVYIKSDRFTIEVGE